MESVVSLVAKIVLRCSHIWLHVLFSFSWAKSDAHMLIHWNRSIYSDLKRTFSKYYGWGVGSILKQSFCWRNYGVKKSAASVPGDWLICFLQIGAEGIGDDNNKKKKKSDTARATLLEPMFISNLYLSYLQCQTT